MTTRRSARLTAKAAAEQIIESQPAQTEKPVRPIDLDYVNVMADEAQKGSKFPSVEETEIIQ